MAKFDIPDEGVSFMEREDAFYNTFGPQGDLGTKPPLFHSSLQQYQDAGREHDEVGMPKLRQERERARHE